MDGDGYLYAVQTILRTVDTTRYGICGQAWHGYSTSYWEDSTELNPFRSRFILGLGLSLSRHHLYIHSIHAMLRCVLPLPIRDSHSILCGLQSQVFRIC